MSIKKYSNFSTEDFLMDDDFIRWILHPDEESNLFWSSFLEKYPQKEQQIKEAIFFIRIFQSIEPADFVGNQENVYKKIRPSSFRVRKLWNNITKIAAAVLLLLSIGGVLYYLNETDRFFPEELADAELLEKGRVVLPDGRIAEFETEQTRIQQSVSGNLTINSDTVKVNETNKSSERTLLTHVIVPYGKRTEIILTDGTKIWLNAGSQLSYPAKFSGNTREVYLSGEAFFDVESDPSKPFQVITGDLKIRATGTRFNVTSYANEEQSQVVLLSGKVDAAKNKRFAGSMEMNPGDRIVYSKSDDNLLKAKVDVEL
ncbi:MAG: FecR domain-containing protein, partial [Porphyromonadaceae bacterium]|nr:FecR domain-containing protein [Porphyromonadaceae bacterium]